MYRNRIVVAREMALHAKNTHIHPAIDYNNIIVWEFTFLCSHDILWSKCTATIYPLTINLLLGPKRCEPCAKYPWTSLFLTNVNCIVLTEILLKCTLEHTNIHFTCLVYLPQIQRWFDAYVFFKCLYEDLIIWAFLNGCVKAFSHWLVTRKLRHRSFSLVSVTKEFIIPYVS